MVKCSHGAAMIHLTSCLLVCLISAANYDAAHQAVRSHWSSQRASVGQPYNRLVNPRAFRLELNVPVGENSEQDHDHLKYKPVYLGPNLLPSHTHSSKYSNKYPQGAPKPGVLLTLSLPFDKTTTTEPPPPPPTSSPTSGAKVVNAEFSYLGPSQGNFFPNPFQETKVNKQDNQPASTAQKPRESKLVSMINRLFIQGGQRNQNSQTDAQKQQDSVIFKPVVPQHSSHGQSGSFSSSQTPNKFWMGHMPFRGSSDGGSDAQAPVHQVVQSTVHYPPSWYPVHKPPPDDDDDGKKDISLSVKNVNGQLMIPLEKCPGFEKNLHILKGHYHGHFHNHRLPYHGHIHQHGHPYHGHGHHSHGHTHQHGHHSHGHGHHSHGHSHQHGHPYHGHIHQHRYPSHDHIHGHVHQHGPLFHGHVHQHGPLFHGHVHQHGPLYHSHVHSRQIETKPNSAQFLLSIQGTAPSLSQTTQETTTPNPSQSPQETNLQLPGVYGTNPFRWWQYPLFGPQNQKLYPPYEQQPGEGPPLTNYMVDVGANVEFPGPDTQTSRSNYEPYERH